MKEELKTIGVAFGTTAVTQVVGQLVNKPINNQPLAYALVGALASAGAIVSKDYKIKNLMGLAGGVAFWLALESFLKEKGMYPLQARALQPQVVYVQPQKKPEGVEIFQAKGVSTY
jgi:hypothetical protein